MHFAPGRFRLAALLGAGALSVHELRYGLAYGDQAGRSAAEQGHAYLAVVVPLVVLAGLFAAAHAIVRAGEPARGVRAHSFCRLWLGCALALALGYCGQELIEGCLAAGHPVGAFGVLGHGGWIGLATAPAVGGLIALAARGAAVAGGSGRPAGAWRPRLPFAPAVTSPTPAFRPSPDPLSRFLAARGPPTVSV